jgi:hypothetical protein
VSERVVVLAALWLAAACPASAQAPPPSGFPGVAPKAPAQQIMSFSADAESITAGMPVTLRWEAINTYSLEIEPAIGRVATRGTRTVFPRTTTVYTLRVTGSAGTVESTIRIDVAGGDAAEAAPEAEAAGTATISVPRLADGAPDLSGVYLGGRDVTLAGEIRLAPGAERFRVPPNENDLGQGAACLPPGVPGATMMPYPLQIVHRPDVLVVLYEAYHLFRIIPIGADHPDYLDPAWMGHSVARWEGDTLVVEAIGFNDRTLVSGHRHTEDMRVVERYRRLVPDVIEYEAIVTDPNVFAEPVRYRGNLVLHPEWQVGEYVCAENNKDYDELFE